MFVFFNHYDLKPLKKSRAYLPLFTHLVVGFILNVLAVNLHNTVSGQQAAVISRRAGLYFADELAAFVALAVQVKAVAAIPFGEETEPGSQLGLHQSRKAGQWKKKKERKRKKRGQRLSEEYAGVRCCPESFNPRQDPVLH